VGFPHFILPPHGGETVGRAGGGKIIKTKQQRADDTLWHFWRWFEYGPSDARTRASVDKVNKIHAAIGRKMPGNFAHNDDFVYTICWIAADMHRLRLRVGLPGYTHNQKISCHRMWQDMATLFVTELGDVTDFPRTSPACCGTWPTTRLCTTSTRLRAPRCAMRSSTSSAPSGSPVPFGRWAGP
jgi:hypothetical protein